MTFPARPLPLLSRRRFLRGAGVALGLPWLESLASAAEAGGPPVRFAALFMGNGVNPHHWGATTGPAGIDPSSGGLPRPEITSGASTCWLSGVHAMLMTCSSSIWR